MNTLVAPHAMVTAARPLMGGRVSVHVRSGLHHPLPDRLSLERAAKVALNRIEAWAGRLTRFDATSELSRLNDAPGPGVPVGPTLAAVLDWGREAESATDGRVDIAMLDARLAAESDRAVSPPAAAARRWSLARGARGAVVLREHGVRLDLDGVAKGWLADRALAVVTRATHGCTTVVDADGDIAIHVAAGDDVHLGVADPQEPGRTLALVRLAAGRDEARGFGLATSGTSVHRWERDDRTAHHLIDPVTWRSAESDVVQATVLADTARVAEAFAKAAVLAGSDLAPALLDRPGVRGALLLTTRGEIRATPGMLPWLA